MNSTNGSISLQLPIWSRTQALKRSSKDWIVRSDCPSICGWYAKLILNWVPNAACRDCQKRDVNLGSLSDTILAGTPCNLNTSRTYKSANLSNDHFWLMAKKWAHFVNLSTTTQIESCPFVDLGKWVTKSMAILSHFNWGISNGSSVPRRPLMLNLGFLTYQARCYKVSNVGFHPIPPEGLFQILIHLSHTWVYAKTTFMPFLHDLFPQSLIPRHTDYISEP